MVALTPGTSSTDALEDPTVLRWASTVRRLLQRGRNPVIAPDLDSALGGEDAGPATIDHLASAIIARPHPLLLDSSIDLHPTWEQPFWDLVCEEHPHLAHWITPQVSLEGLIGQRDLDGDGHWVDFLLRVPWRSASVVLEIDGSGHERSRAVDAERDRRLADCDIETHRIEGPDLLDPAAPYRRALRRIEGERPPLSDPEVIRHVLGPALVHRLAFAIALLAEAGHLTPRAECWRLRVVDDLGVTAAGIPWLLRFLRRVDVIVGDSIVPDRVEINGQTWRTGPDFCTAKALDDSVPDASIVLEPFVAPHGQLPEINTPTVLIRPAMLPNQPGWWPEKVTPRWNLPDDIGRDVEGALEGLAHDLYGYPSLRPGQLSAILQVLRGRDSVVLLPTGSGKSLIYQLTGVLRPGLCLIVDPIQALIDDQDRRFRDAGIDRVVAIHSGRTRDPSARAEVLGTIARGDALFALVTPERLQNTGFRSSLASAAYETTVNLAVVDEAHCVSEWGHDFRPAFLRLGASLRRFGRNRWDESPPILALTGTASPRVLSDTLSALDIDRSLPGALQHPESFDRPNLRFHIHAGSPSEKRTLLRDALRTTIPEVLGVPAISHDSSGIIFLPNVDGSKGLAEARDALLHKDVLADSLGREHIGFFAGRVPSQGSGRDKVPLYPKDEWIRTKREFATAFIRGNLPVLVATKAFGMGIDKPDIRFTIHLGYPSSIEAFAQEAGRAGRDGATSCCVIVGLLPEEHLVEERLRDPQRRPPKGRGGKTLWRDDDWGSQEFFLFNSYPGVEDETAQVIALYRELRRLGAKSLGELDVPPQIRLVDGRPLATGYREAADSDSSGELSVQRLLHRLFDVGVVDDIEYSSGGNLRVLFADFEPLDAATERSHIDTALLQFLARNDPGRLRAHRQSISTAPPDLDARVEHHIRVAVEAVYDVIFRARLNALEAMHRLVKETPTEEVIRRRIAAYLGRGPMADALEHLTRDPQRLDIRDALRRFSASPPSDEFEWAGAAERLREDFPNHPIVLLISALGEFHLHNGSKRRFTDFIGQALHFLIGTDTTREDQVQLVGWALQLIRASPDASRRAWLRDAWQPIGASELGRSGAFAQLESTVLMKARGGDFVTEELDAIQGILLQRARLNFAKDTDHLRKDEGHGDR